MINVVDMMYAIVSQGQMTINVILV